MKISPENATKYAAIFYLLTVGLSSLYVALLDSMAGKELPDYIKMIVASGITYCLTALSINHGSNIALKGASNATSIP